MLDTDQLYVKAMECPGVNAKETTVFGQPLDEIVTANRQHIIRRDLPIKVSSLLGLFGT